MNKNVSGCYNHNSYALTIIFVGMLFVLTGCCCCGGELTSNVQKDPTLAKSREIPAKKEDASLHKTGMLFSFADGGNKTNQKAAALTTSADYKDLYAHLNLRKEKNCPFGVESANTFLTAGPNVSFKSAGNDVYPNSKHKPGIGFQAGFGTVYRFNEKWAVVPSLLYKQNRASEEGTITDGDLEPGIDIEDKYSFNYLSAPLLVQYNLTDDLTLRAGPEINYLLKAKVNSSTSYGDDSHSVEQDISDNCVKVGVGVQVGLQYQIPDSRWGLQVTYDHRLSRLNKKERDGYEVDAWRMKGVQVGVTCLVCDLIKGKKK